MTAPAATSSANPFRLERMMRNAIRTFSLDLSDICVLTEAATGIFAVTPVIAALAGSQRVIAVTRDSSYGSAADAIANVEALAVQYDVAERIDAVEGGGVDYADQASLITNLGFVRPLTCEFIRRLPEDAGIALMWETWEFREEDVDLEACRERSVPILGTIETIPELMTFRYVGLVVLKLLFEAGFEVFRSNVVVIGSGHFGDESVHVLTSNGANVVRLCPGSAWPSDLQRNETVIRNSDAVVLVEHHSTDVLIGPGGGIPADWIAEAGAVVIPVCGAFDAAALDKHSIPRHPCSAPRPGAMSVTTHYVGAQPVIELHTAGLKVGEALVRGMRRFGDAEKAVAYALSNSPAMDFEGR